MNMYSAEHVPADEIGEISVDEGVAGSQAWHDRYTITTKLKVVVLSSTVVMAVLAALMLATMAYFSNVGETLRMVAVADGFSSHATVDLYEARDHLGEYAETREADDLAGARDAMTQSLGALDEILTQDIDRLDQGLVSELQRAREEAGTISAQLSSSNPRSNEARETARAVEQVIDGLVAATSGLGAQSIAAAEPVFENIRNSLIVLLCLFVAMTVSSLVVSRGVSKSVAGMIGTMTQAMLKISEGATDTPIPGRTRQDEIGDMARALQVFRNSTLELRDMTDARAREAEEQLAQQNEINEKLANMRREKSQLLDGLAGDFEVSVGEVITAVSAASEQLKATSKQMVTLAEGSNEQAEDATAQMKKATDNVTAAAAATDEFALSISEISRQAASSAELARGASELVDSANTRMSDLSGAAEEIGEIASLIQTIAQRTNLLALNASIEAARGGEAGRGFAVVASEVKELAMQTSNATASVTEKITAMQDSTRSSASDLTSIVAQIGELEQVAVMIATAVDQQSVSGDELARNIDTVASGSAQVGQRLEALRLASEETGSAADDVVDSADALASHAEELRTKAGRFIADVRKSARDLDGEAA